MAVPSSGVRRLIVVGQLSIDTIIMLDAALAVGDGNSGTFSRSLGGTGAIVAFNAAILGLRPIFTGHVGTGADDDAMAAYLQHSGTVIGPTCGVGTGLRVQIIVAPGGERTMVSNGARPDWSALDPGFHRNDVVFFEGWHLVDDRGREPYTALMRQAADRGATVVLDVCTAGRIPDRARHADLLRSLRVDVVFANAVEADAFGLVTSPPAPLVVVHRGAASTLAVISDVVHEFPVDAVAPLDTSGAGDAFAAGFLTSVCRREDLVTAVSRGHRAARQIVQIVGPLLPPIAPPALIRTPETTTAAAVVGSVR